jgi:tRNA nucleotidyltransferase (CCA-adding enzyme)
MRVFEIMSDRVTTVTPDTRVAAARTQMETAKADYLVVTSARQVVGVVSRRDLDAAAQSGLLVAEVMTSPAVTIESSALVRKAANLMEGRTLGFLPVTDRGQLAGVVTIADLLRLIGKGADRPQTRSRRGLNHRVPHRKGHSPSGRW